MVKWLERFRLAREARLAEKARYRVADFNARLWEFPVEAARQRSREFEAVMAQLLAGGRRSAA